MYDINKGVALRESIQKQSFVSADETIFDAVQAAHANKKKKISVLCLVTNAKGEGHLWQVGRIIYPKCIL